MKNPRPGFWRLWKTVILIVFERGKGKWANEKICIKTFATVDSDFAGHYISFFWHDADCRKWCGRTEDGKYRKWYFTGGCWRSQRRTWTWQTIPDPVCGLAWKPASWRHGDQLCVRKTSVQHIYFQTSGNPASDCCIYFTDDSDIYSTWNSVSDSSESLFRLSDPNIKFHR